MKKLFTYFSNFAPDNKSGMHRLWTDNGPMKSRKLFAVLTLLLFLGVGNVWGAEGDIAYTLDFTAKTATNNSYTNTWTYGDFSLYAGSNNSKNWAYVRFGGKGGSNTSSTKTINSTITSTTVIASTKTIKQITIEHTKVTSGNYTANKCTLQVASNSDFSSIIDTRIIDNPVKNGTSFNFTPNEVTVWPASSYYKITIGATIKGTSNIGVEIAKVKFVEGASGGGCDKQVNITNSSTTSVSHGSFDVDKTGSQDACSALSVTITPDPDDHYHVASVSATNPATTGTAGAAVDNGDGTYTITYSANAKGNSTISVTFAEDTHYTVTWMSNGSQHTTTEVYSGEKPTFPSNPSSCDGTSTAFYGWATSTWTGKLDDVSAKTIYLSGDAMPAVSASGTIYHAVFAKESATAFEKITSADNVYVGQKLAIVSNKQDYILPSNFNATTAATHPNSNDNKLTVTSSQVWTITDIDEYGYYKLKNSTTQMGVNRTSGLTSGSAAVGNYSTVASWWAINETTDFDYTVDDCFYMYNWATATYYNFLENSGSSWLSYYAADITSGNKVWYAMKLYQPERSEFLTTCCTNLGSINGSINMSSSTDGTVTISGWTYNAGSTGTTESNVSSYTVKLYKWNGSAWAIANASSTTGGSSGTAATRTGIATDSKSVTYSGLEYGGTYKFTVTAIGTGSYCDGPETAVTSINGSALTDNKFLNKYYIRIDDGTQSDTGWENHYITSLTSHAGSVDVTLNAFTDYYQYKLSLGGVIWWGNNSKMTSSDHTSWTLYTNQGNVKLQTAMGGTYTFGLNAATPAVTVTYPTSNQASGYKIYFDNSILNWSTLRYRIGNNSHNQNSTPTLVTGTDNFYVATTPSYDGMEAWHFANNTGWADSHTIYRTATNNESGQPEIAITASIVFQQYKVTEDITVIPTTSHTTGTDNTGDKVNNQCEFYTINTPTSGMLTHTATISATTNGSINLAYTDVSGTSQNKTSTTSSLAHRTKITASAIPSTGYEINTFTVTPSGGDATNLTSGATDNHILAKDATFAATFAAKTYAISLDRNGGTTGATEVTMTYNSSSFTGWSAPSRTGYTFDGYYTSETNDNGTGTLVINSSGVLQANVDGYTGANGIWTKDATCTLYAKWTANTTTVTLTAGTGTNGSASINYDATSYTSFSAAVRVGYTCTGYWTNTGGTGTKILNANGSFAASTISGYVTSDKWSYTTASTLTLYAGWTNTYAGYAFDLLEDVRDISAGSKIILIGTNAGGSSFYALKTTQQTDYRDRIAAGAGEFVMSNSNKTATLGASTSVQVITLEDLATPADNTYQFNVENGYLYAASSSSNYLRTQSPNTSNGNWLIALDASTKKATVTAKGDKTHNILSHNNTYTRFSAYTSEQQPTYIYYKETRTKYTITWDKNGHGTAPTYPTNAARVTMPDISVTGYTNTGWKADKAVTNVSSGATISAGTLISNDTRVQLSANTTFTAQWSTDVYTISATLTNISVNSAFPSSFTYTGATTTDLDRTLSVTSAYALPTNLTVTMGGNPCTNGTEYTYDSGTGAFTFNVVITGNIVITGTALNKYTLTLNPGNGSLTEGGGWSADGDNLVQVVVAGNTVTMPSATPGCAGWSFVGWNEDTSVDNVSSNPVDKAGGATFTPAATKTYYAVYRASTPTGTTYTKITDEAELTTGDYLIVGYPGSSYYYAMGNSTTSGHMTEISSTNATSWSSPSAGYVWTIIKAGDKVGFYNANASKYLTIVDGAWVLNSTDGQKFSYSFNSTTKAWTFTSPSGKQMIYNSYFYTGDAQSSAIYLYKRGNTESGNYYTSPDCSSLTVTGVSDPVGAATVHLSSTTAKNGDVIWATYTLNRGYTFNSWDKSGTGASLSSTSAEFTKLTVGSADPTITVNCDALTSYTLNYHDGDGNHTMTAYEGEKILEILPEASESCDGESTTYTGWSTSEIRTKTDDEPTYVSSSAVINSTTAASTYYAVYADVVTPDGTLSILGSLGSSFWGASYNSNDKKIDDSNGNTITLNTDNVIFQNPSSVNCVQIKNASGAGFWNDTEIPGNITQIKIKCETSGAKIYVGTTKKPTSSNEKTVSSTTEQTYDFDASDGLTYFSVFSNSATPQIKSMIITYVGEYGDYITTCCDAPTITINGTGKMVTDGKISFPVLREDLGGASSTTWAELPITISSNSSGAISIINGSMPEGGGNIDNAAKTAWKLSEWESRAESGGTITGTDHATFTNPSSENYLFRVKTTTGLTGQGTYRIGIHQAADATYCEAVVWMWVDVTLRDKFVDKVNANTTINVDGHGSTVTTPTESSLDADKNDDCHETTRRLVGWVKETDMDTWYGSSSDRTRDLDDKKDDAKLVAPGATITTSGATWYAVWGEEVTE